MTERMACLVDDIKPGAALRFDVPNDAGTRVAVAVVRADDGDYFAIGDTCSHGEVSLAEGEVDGCEIECWGHGGRFDFRTGKAVELPAISPVPAYPVRIDGDRVLVDVDAPLTLQKENA